MKYTPLNNFIIVQKVPASTKTASGIILQTSRGTDQAKVIAVSDGDLEKFGIESSGPISVGDALIIRWDKAYSIDDEHYAVSSKDVVCKVAD